MHFQEWDGEFVPSVPFLWETGIKKYKTDTPGVPVLCPLNGTVQQDMHAPGTQTRCRQDATPDFPACLCGNTPYRRHGNSGTGRMHPAVSGGIVPQPHSEPKGRPVQRHRWLYLFPLACESWDRQGILAPVTLSLVYEAYGSLYGGIVAARRPGCKDERI